MWLKVVILQALLQHSMAEVFTMCLNVRAEFRCNVPENLIRCQHGIAGFQKFEYVLEKQPLSMCCAGLQYACRVQNQNLLKILRIRCTKKQACSIPLEINEMNDETVDLSCGYEGEHYRISQIEIEYTCLSDMEIKAETSRATGDSNVNSDTGGTSVVVVTVASVLAVMAIIVVIIVALIVYKRRSRRKTQERNNNTTEVNRESQVYNGFEGEYNIIPADFDVIPNTTYQVLGDLHSGNEHGYSINARKPSGKYSTIVLNDDDTETDKSACSHYDKANLRRKNNAEKEKDSEYMHTYSHFNETSDDYNRVTSRNSRLGVDEDYPNFGSKVEDDYSHLNDKQDTTDSPNDYNVLVTKVKQNAPEKDVASYKQVVVESASNPRNEESSITGYETPVNLERSETYEANNTNHVSNEKLKRVDSYEKPVNLELDLKPYAPMKRVDSYEQPVLKSTSNSKNEQTFVKGYELSVSLERSENYEVNDNNHVSNEKLNRVDSYEQPVCMSKTKVENTQYNEQKDSHSSCDNYETPVTLKVKTSIDSEPENNVRL